jgi:outer membrane protein TolC
MRQPVYAGGELWARRSQAQASARAARWTYRMAEKDLELEVSFQFATFLAAEREIGFRREGLDRLQTYLVSVHSRRAAGVAVASDVFKTQSRIADEEANLAAAQRQLDDARLQLNELMGRAPPAPLALRPLPEPGASPVGGDLSWQLVPDLAMARAVAEAAAAGGELVRATRRPHLDLAGDLGLFGPGLNGGSLGSRLRTDFGSTLTLTLTWPFFDFGIYAGRRLEADALAVQAERRVAALARRSRLEWERANSQLAGLYREIEARRRAVPIARDSYLSAESLYRGGSGTALEVLDAYSSLIGALRSYSQAVLAFRVAQAQGIRWGSP